MNKNSGSRGHAGNMASGALGDKGSSGSAKVADKKHIKTQSINAGL